MCADGGAAKFTVCSPVVEVSLLVVVLMLSRLSITLAVLARVTSRWPVIVWKEVPLE